MEKKKKIPKQIEYQFVDPLMKSQVIFLVKGNDNYEFLFLTALSH